MAVASVRQLDNPVGFTTKVASYVFLALANLLFNGLLCLHTLLDNPFGDHPLQFALRSETTNLITCGARSHPPRAACVYPASHPRVVLYCGADARGCCGAPPSTAPPP